MTKSLPRPLQPVKDICKKVEMLDVHYLPKENEICFTDDGLPRLRLRVMDNKFGRFKICSTFHPPSRPYLTRLAAVALATALRVPLNKKQQIFKKPGMMIGRDINLKQLLEFTQIVANFYLRQAGKNKLAEMILAKKP